MKPQHSRAFLAQSCVTFVSNVEGRAAVGIELERLSPFGLFEGLSKTDLAFVAANCIEKTIPKGTLLIQQGQVGKDVYLLEAGSVRVHQGDAVSARVKAVLQAPTILGEMALLDPERIRTSSVTALSELRILSIPIGTFMVLLGVYPSLKDKLKKLIASRT
jgi:CRP-like cAMP-binding protein